MSEQQPVKIIGSVNDFAAFPAAVNVDNNPFFIVEAPRKDDEPQRYNLISAICPHAGGMVRPHLNELICPLHYWCFDLATGESTNIPGEQLECAPLEIRDGQFTLKV
ncbi:Rieske (2Fe-2S) protein [Paenibacillus sacheonensis]|uniref:Rieske 2Fe-2S domain-containing protein n=1 Tax=Paenibacillus sacheonensis TaxID=742054 RepID=A0A7X4YNS4_9BACL|nr:Rieske (2Fe-2S) protein [Paenibacillus sacheonensis]MBM7565355.1 nitrite reductase/ring-hydroxylating ferredoxin subunit [Paenibacillus sacheonensis]NBC69715.1 Rieske 2Fe-2S domain-containing protein [Paenibacillus sacheonensis]